MVEKLMSSAGTDSSKEYAKLQSFFSVLQTVGSFFSGILLDRFGIKGGFIVSFLGSAACYALLSQATTLEILYWSKVPSIFQAGFLCAQVGVTQVTLTGSDRVVALGRLTMSYTIGSIIGPAVGGMLGASGDYYYGAKLAVVGSLISVVLTLLMPAPQIIQSAHISETNDEDHHLLVKGSPSSLLATSAEEKPIVEEVVEDEAEGASTVVGVIKRVWLFLFAKVVTSVANAIAQAAFPLVLKNNFHFQEQSMGFTMSLMSGFNALVNGALLGPIVAWAGGDLCFLIGVSIGVMGFLSLTQAIAAVPTFSSASWQNGVGEFLILTFVLSMVQYVLATTITSESSSRVGVKARGTLLGLEHSLFAAARIITPQVGVGLLESGGVCAVSGACSGVFFVVYLIFQSLIDGQQKKKKPSPVDGEGKKK